MTGILLIDKPSGWTSSDVVAKLRGVLRERRIGHSGTLDPKATGLLVVFVGRATRAVEFAESQEKRYRAGLRLGLETDTQDITGRPIGGEKREISTEELENVLASFRGEIEQIPPMYSAIKVKGQKLYEIARRGGEVERRPRRITIHDDAICHGTRIESRRGIHSAEFRADDCLYLIAEHFLQGLDCGKERALVRDGQSLVFLYIFLRERGDGAAPVGCPD